MGETYDAIVVGSGATGGWAAKELTEAPASFRKTLRGRIAARQAAVAERMLG